MANTQTFYLKYRPQKIEDLDIGSVRESFKKIIESKNIPHALLFAGPKGTGKTSAARIIAKSLNCLSNSTSRKASRGEPCNKCEQCTSISNGNNIDVIEMDAASNRGIDDIRILRDVVKLSPSKAKTKIYIIDEAHMLTTEASNALLKTLEEPPEHVYFILATTNPEKLINTIRSRATMISFNKASPSEIIRSLKRIIKAEKIKISDSNLELIVKIAKGSFRDAVKILERVSTEGTNFLKVETSSVAEIIKDIEEKDKKNIFTNIQKSISQGLTVIYLIEEILEVLRNKLLNKEDTNLSKQSLVYLIELLIKAIDQTKISPIEELPLELAFFKWFTKIDGPNNLEKNS